MTVTHSDGTARCQSAQLNSVISPPPITDLCPITLFIAPTTPYQPIKSDITHHFLMPSFGECGRA